ncbi:NADH-quinone oxidoreductase subunit NuoE [Geodermatophilus obscurus]|jgi:NADH-quinone oxidoreductase subunit E|uniref:NADH dehydrogenase (Ubiquinone) 24 kDa subunit n=1 Tax=Geodermatophilus obscurus (strain ATCC 25078 / DSM 43160 / JCM 3152 / CCUG 61914 / KCC A-0152 / KCTC 9177 / NBRC 13315 / NRRL B-3577 / G-20) TaxID=526225 RepID=D2SHF0_GEOOG|nr:NADH-quinone oxidoreductase subunit NuoE [Geodermatophilus obscurus]ADB77104.1 NADH dehydrogenase (ubiquinone) 24 kDa subunit [Geodermatophilus obscurus DSM 43160]
MSALPGSAEGTAVTGLDSSPVEPAAADLPPLTEQVRLEAREIIARYPQPRSALLPMLHLVQSHQGYVTPEGVALCAEELGLTKAEVGAVATFYTMYKRRPTGRHLVSVCTNTLCAVLGGQRIFDALSRDLGVHHDETAADGSVTLEHAECLAACDYAPVVTVDYEFYDQQDVDSARELVAALRRGEKPHPTRGAPLTDFRGVSRQLAGFDQYGGEAARAAAVDAEGAIGPTLAGLRLAAERGESAPPMPPRPPADEAEPAGTEPREATRPSGRTGETPEEEAADARVAAADNPAERAGAAQAHPDKGAEYGQPRGRQHAGTENPPAAEPATGTTPTESKES